MIWTELVQTLGGTLEPEDAAHPHCQLEQASLFQTFEGAGTEIETLWLLWALVRMTKPQFVLETGTLHGIGTIALASALKENGRGKVVSLEIDREIAMETCGALKSTDRLESADLTEFFEIVNQDSLTFIEGLDTKQIRFDFAFFDSKTNVRLVEFKRLYEKGGLTNLVAFHDTSRLREKTFIAKDESQDAYVAELDKIEKNYCRGAMEFTLAKGLRVMQLDKNINPAFY